MKRIFFIILAMLLVFCCVGCGTSTDQPSQSVETPEATPEPTLEATPTPEPTETQAMTENKEITVNEITALVPSTWEESPGEEGIYYYYADNNNGFLMIQVQEYLGDTEKIPNSAIDGFLDVFEPEDKSAAKIEETEIAGRYALRCEIEGKLSEVECHIIMYFFLYGDCMYSVGVLSQSDTLDEPLKSFPGIVDSIKLLEPTTSETPTPEPTQEQTSDIVADKENREKIKSMNEDLEYEELSQLLDAYIKENNPSEEDSVFTIKKEVEEILKVLPECEVVTDEFEDSKIIYGDVQKITSKVNFVPFISPDTWTEYINAKVGFQKSNWLFFEQVKIKLGEDDYIEEFLDYDEVVRDVVKGSNIKEEGEASLAMYEAEKLLKVKKPVMRFIGEDEKTRDHNITDAELKALDKLYRIAVHRDAIDTLIDDWEEAHEQ